MEAAICCFDELGYEQTSFSRIAEIAGTSKSLVTYFFPTKRALAGTIVDLAYPGGVFMGAKRTENDPLDAIVSVAEQVAESILHNPLARVALMLVEQQSSAPHLAAGKFSGWIARLTDYLEEAQSKGLVSSRIDASREAKYLLCGVVGLVELARGTDAYLRLVEDAVQLTRDRLDRVARRKRCDPLRGSTA
ncbi:MULTISPECIES: TetR/AcrR family transcriptional regulator [unclassified Microbacterium]|uniref:TetR/AcrR family transcriptional regulator n=1 Tax=unclassified Microbacterium TaxID=2609290 RepID=UPI0030171B3E